MVHVKICGITNLADARAAIDAGADLLGFNFYPPSPRYISPERAREIISVVRRSSSVQTAGVFVNEPLERVRAIVELCELDLIQMHGEESAELVAQFAPRVYKSLRPRDAADAKLLIEKYRVALNGNRPGFIVDAFNAKLFGGAGEQGDWKVASEIAREFPILLAGGLNPDNVAEAIRAVQPWGVDVASGVERAPGLKDHAKVREFVARAKQVLPE